MDIVVQTDPSLVPGPPRAWSISAHFASQRQSSTWTMTSQHRTPQHPLLQTCPSRHPPPAPDTSTSTASDLSIASSTTSTGHLNIHCIRPVHRVVHHQHRTPQRPLHQRHLSSTPCTTSTNHLEVQCSRKRSPDYPIHFPVNMSTPRPSLLQN